MDMLHNVLGVLRNVLGVLHNVLGVLHILSRYTAGTLQFKLSWHKGRGRPNFCFSKSQECHWQDWYIFIPVWLTIKGKDKSSWSALLTITLP